MNAGGKEGRSHLENSRNPGHALETFTQKEIDDSVISFVHRGEAGSGRVALRVSDGIETGAAAMLRVVAFPLQLRLVNNTGLVMTHNASSLIIPRNLAFVTNADEPELLEINYEITKSPQFGVLQRIRNSNNGDNSNNNNNENKWQNIQHFTSFQLAREQIRYIHTSGSPTHDEFKVCKQYFHSISFLIHFFSTSSHALILYNIRASLFYFLLSYLLSIIYQIV